MRGGQGQGRGRAAHHVAALPRLLYPQHKAPATRASRQKPRATSGPSKAVQPPPREHSHSPVSYKSQQAAAGPS